MTCGTVHGRALQACYHLGIYSFSNMHPENAATLFIVFIKVVPGLC